VAHARAQDDGRVRLISRNERDHTRRFPHLVEALTKLMPASFTLDGEVAVFDEELISRFEWLRHLNHGDLATPPLYMVFDLLRARRTTGRNLSRSAGRPSRSSSRART
jgi:ATP-dependent DNA ligase